MTLSPDGAACPAAVGDMERQRGRQRKVPEVSGLHERDEYGTVT
jgi:hypothetical protein